MEGQLISFNTAKLAKEKGWTFPTLNFYFEDSQLKENTFKEITGMDYGSEFTVEFSELTENWNDKFLTKKDGNRCSGCSKTKGYFETFSAPTQALLQKWLREKHNIHIMVGKETEYNDKCGFPGNEFDFYIQQIPDSITDHESYKTYEKALEVALYEALKLIKNENI